MQALVQWLARHPYRVILVTGVLSVFALLLCFNPVTMTPRLVIDPAVEHLLPAGDGDRAVAERVREIFGDADAVIVAVKFGNVCTPQKLDRIERITQRFRTLDGVSAVVSLATVPNLLAQGEDVEVSSFTEQAKRDPALITEFPKQFAANPLYRGTLLSLDGSTASFALVMGSVTEAQFLQRDYPTQIRAIVREIAGDSPVWVTGTPIGGTATTKALIKTIKFTIPAVFGVILLLLLIAFRSFRAMLVAAATVGTALLWTMATAAFLHIPMNLVTAIVPPLVITLGLSYSIYLLSAYFTAVQEPTLKTKVDRTVWLTNRASVGLMLSAGTTVISFMALLLNVLPAIKHFAVLASIGSAFGVLLSLTFMPAALAIIGTTRTRRTMGEVMFANWAQKLARFDQKWRGWIIAIALIMIPLDLLFAARIHAGSEFIKSFDEKAQVRQDFEAVNTAFNGANMISILIETHVNDALTDPGV